MFIWIILFIQKYNHLLINKFLMIFICKEVNVYNYEYHYHYNKKEPV